MPSKIGIFGGTFNPIHNGHIKIALAALSEYDLSEVVFMPNGNPPHKKGELITDAELRYKMVKLATEGIDGLSVSCYEIKREEPSYTVDTNRAMKKLYGCTLYFIIGADSLFTLDSWKTPEILIKECKFIVADRNCNEGTDIYKECERLNKLGGDFSCLKMEKYDVTSTQLRQRIKAGINCSDYIPENVLNFIVSNKLYTS
ncbi:MAG: nicotinate-nucleotide adenylyltransferase [Clostridia bacterium]|nr:nicotinate-nucleotide adenylyltransferase [Clostridia bacterium]